MPNFITVFGYHVYIWTNEGQPLEPVHVHASKVPSKNATKIWILSDGTCKLANNDSEIPTVKLNRLLKTLESYSDEIVKTWEKVFGEKAIFYK